MCWRRTICCTSTSPRRRRCAPGEAPGTFALESALDELAYALKMDPVELRLVNYTAVNPSNDKPWSSNHLKDCYRIGAEMFGWKDRKPEPRSMRDGKLLVGWGMATATYPGHRFPASAMAHINADGKGGAVCATQDLGTGAYTVFAQTTADALGLPVEKVTFELGDRRCRRGRSPADRTRQLRSAKPSSKRGPRRSPS